MVGSDQTLANATANATVNAAGSNVLDWLVKQFNYLLDIDRNVKDLMEALGRLQARRDDLRHQNMLTVRDDLFSRIAKIENIVAKIQEHYENRRLRVGSLSFSFYSSYKISRKARRECNNIEELLRQCGTFKRSEIPPACCVEEPVPPVLIGMESYLGDTIRYLDDENVVIIGVCGMAGVGKSVLLRRINNSFLPGTEREAKFEFVIWVQQPKDLDVCRLQDEIARRLRLPVLEDLLDLEERALPIFNFLRRKSFLLIMDDLTKPLDLKSIGMPYPNSSSEKKQKVIFSTRHRGVCGRMNADRIDMKCLNWEDSWTLFKNKVSEERISSNCMINNLAQQVAKECGGLPLALINIGTSMSTKKDPRDWSDTIKFLKSSRLHEIPGMENDNMEMLRVIKQSYDNLAKQSLKDCFLSCSLWPEGYSFKKTELVEFWIGLGLIEDSLTMHQAVLKGFTMINELEEANLLESGNKAGEEVKKHDIVRDLALWIASECGKERNKWLVQAGVDLSSVQQLKEKLELARSAERVSLMHSLIEKLPKGRLEKSKLLMLQYNEKLDQVSGNFLQYMHDLSYLDLACTGIKEIPEEIGQLQEIQYLNLSYTLIESLPKELGNLSKLKYLLLADTKNLSEIPTGVFQCLVNLKILDMYRSRYAKWEGKEGGTNGETNESGANLKEIEFLFIKSLGITISSVQALQTLSRLDNICTRRLLITSINDTLTSITLHPSIYETFSLFETLNELTISDLEELEELLLDGGDDVEQQQGWCLPKLEKLELDNLSNLREVKWKGISMQEFFPLLQSVKISNCNRLKNVNWVLNLPRLENLELKNCLEMEKMIDDKFGIGEAAPTFPCLKTLLLYGMERLEYVCGREINFPSLQVQVVGCKNFNFQGN